MVQVYNMLWWNAYILIMQAAKNVFYELFYR